MTDGLDFAPGCGYFRRKANGAAHVSYAHRSVVCCSLEK
jgi:hypothetical protein